LGFTFIHFNEIKIESRDYMEKTDIIKSIAERTGGDIFLGVVGAVRTGKSTFIKRFMESLVIPNKKMNMKEKEQWMKYHKVCCGKQL
jgi:septin family protein